jgi:hypothetical protein
MRKGLIVFLAAFLVAAFTLPAMADMSASGFYHGFAILSNFHDGSGGPSLRNEEEKQTNAYVAQRFRVKFSFGTENVKAVWYLESDMIWGDSAGSSSPGAATRNVGGALGADKVQTETKNIYVWFKVPNTSISSAFGLQNVSDVYSGLFNGANDMGAITIKGKFDPVSYNFLFGKLYENAVQKSDDATLWAIETAFSPTKEAHLGLNFYYLEDDTGAQGVGSGRLAPLGALDGYRLHIYMPGINAAYKAGPVKLTGWFFYQGGKFDSTLPGGESADVQAFAVNARGEMNVGPGQVWLEGLYLSGGDLSGDNPKYKAPITLGDFQGANTSPGGFSNYTSTHMIIMLSTWNMATVSQCLIGCSGAELSQSPGNGGRGIWHVAAGYDQKFTDTLKGEINVGYLAATKTLESDFSGRKKDIGTEVNATLTYSAYKGLDLGLTGAYVFLGDFVKHETPGDDFKDPWTGYFRVSYAF